MSEFNVSQLLKSPVGTSRQFELDEPAPSVADVELVDSVQGAVRLTRTRRGVLVDARLRIAVRIECSRCLEAALRPIRIHIAEEFASTHDFTTGLPVENPPEADEFTIDEHHMVDLSEPIRQYALLELPMQPLCRPDCAGLCSICGRNRNEEACDCESSAAPAEAEPWIRLLEQVDRADEA